MPKAKIKFWGVRGSIAAPGKKTAGFGGNTTCVDIEYGGSRVICDAGTGIRPLGLYLMKRFGKRPMEAMILLSHVHWDHYIGLPFFRPIYNDKNRFTIAGPRVMDQNFESALKDAIQPPYFPISTVDFNARVEYTNIGPAEYQYGEIRIVPHEAHHPQGAYGWRFYFKDKRSIVLMTDNEPRGTAMKNKLVEFMVGADAIIHDAQYTPEVYSERIGWGHSPYTFAIDIAKAAGTKKIFLTHHDPESDDACLRNIFTKAKSYARSIGCRAKVEMAREGLSFSV